MRIISQNGNVDLPYEKALIFHATETVLARCEGYDKEIVLGEYSSMEKAYKAMEMLRDAYNNNEFYHHTATTDDFKDAMNLLSNEKFEEETSEYFQFPQDDEIEV